ncbi:sugar ABC transporter substrate-binding protein [Actinospica durhamensis]|uniref:Sugar ABC transporter substrate-binding protein n=1 Tax=Actinospica durhamensis TaxID=1508375 RepID=A0A941IVC9_9ACTN|nr:sugar ABC transporter substrate-binding protein [Actinospica durhamensis]
MHRRKFLQLAASAAAAGPLLSACGSSSGSSSGGGNGPVTLTISTWSMATTPEFKALFDAFHKAYPNITIKPVDILAADYSTKVKVMLSGGDSTDIITMKNTTDYGQFAERGQLRDISSLAAGSTASSLQGLSSFNMNDKYYALPYRQDFWALFYNKKLFDAAGKPYPTNMTWDEYAALAESLTSGSGGSKVYGTYHHTWRSVVQAISAAQTGGDLIGGKYEFFTDQYNTALGIQDAGATLDYGTATTEKTGYQAMIETGKAAMLPMGTWLIGTLLADKKSGATDIDWSMAPMPQRPGAGGITTFGSPTAFSINSRAQNVDAAEKFIEFATGPQGAAIVAGIGIVPALLDDDTRKVYFGLDGMPADSGFQQAFKPDKVVLEMPVSDKSSQIDTILTAEHTLVMTKQKSIAGGIAEMDSRVQTEVE